MKEVLGGPGRGDDDKYRSQSDCERKHIISVLMQKHTLLAIISILVAIIAYVSFDILMFSFETMEGTMNITTNGTYWQLSFLFIDIDMVIKTITCILMFKFYERKFYKICWCCIKIAAIPCCCCKNATDPKSSLFDPLAKRAQGVYYKRCIIISCLSIKDFFV